MPAGAMMRFVGAPAVATMSCTTSVPTTAVSNPPRTGFTTGGSALDAGLLDAGFLATCCATWELLVNLVAGHVQGRRNAPAPGCRHARKPPSSPQGGI